MATGQIQVKYLIIQLQVEIYNYTHQVLNRYEVPSGITIKKMVIQHADYLNEGQAHYKQRAFVQNYKQSQD
jgi:hypothetical protein